MLAHCPFCKFLNAADDHYAGAVVACHQCRQPFTLPASHAVPKNVRTGDNAFEDLSATDSARLHPIPTRARWKSTTWLVTSLIVAVVVLLVIFLVGVFKDSAVENAKRQAVYHEFLKDKYKHASDEKLIEDAFFYADLKRTDPTPSGRKYADDRLKEVAAEMHRRDNLKAKVK